MTTLTEFLLARIAEDEAAAHDRLGKGALSTSVILQWQQHRVLAECEAKRRIVELHAYDWNPRGLCMACDIDGPCPTLHALALPYDAHPDYDEAWRP